MQPPPFLSAATPTVPGPVSLLRSSDCTLWPDFAVQLHRMPAMERPDALSHGYLVGIQLSGPHDVEWTVGGRVHGARKAVGSVTLTPVGPARAVRWRTPIDLLLVALRPAFLHRVAETLNLSTVELAPRQGALDDTLRTLCTLLERDFEAGSPTGRLYGEHLAHALAVHLLTHYNTAPAHPAPLRGGLPPARLRRVQDYIAAHLDRDLTLTELAVCAQLSPDHFGRLFRQSTGLTPHQYVLRARIDLAKDLLTDPYAPLADIAARLGFSHQAHFTTLFRRLVGTTPQNYRRAVAS